MPLGSTEPIGHSAMLNMIGGHPDVDTVRATIPEAVIHDYGKQARPGRKVGHITICDPDAEVVAEAVTRLRPMVGYYDQC